MSVFYQSMVFYERIHQIRLLTAKNQADAKEVLSKLARWSQSHTFSIEQAYNLYIRDIQYYGEPNMTAEAFIE